MDDLVTLVDAWSPGAAAQLQPASSQDIQWLESLAQQPLPPAYRRFLETMGASAGPLRLDDADCGIDSVVRYLEAMPWTGLPRYLCIAPDEDPQAPESFFLDLQRRRDDDCAVVRFAFPESGTLQESDVRTITLALRDTLLRAAFASLRLEALGHEELLAPQEQDQSADATVARIASDFGLASRPGGDRDVVFDGDAASMLVARSVEDDSIDWIHVAAADPQTIVRIRAALQEHLLCE